MKQQISAKPDHDELVVARVHAKSFGEAANGDHLRARGRLVGQARWCYTRALAEDPGYRGFSDAPPLAGRWVARIARDRGGRTCALEVVDTDLPEELSLCVRGKLLQMHQLLDAPGRLELVVTFNPP